MLLNLEYGKPILFLNGNTIDRPDIRLVNFRCGSIQCTY